jgi:hypothetical protein
MLVRHIRGGLTRLRDLQGTSSVSMCTEDCNSCWIGNTNGGVMKPDFRMGFLLEVLDKEHKCKAEDAPGAVAG